MGASEGRTVTVLGLSEEEVLGFLLGKVPELVLSPVSLPLEPDELLPLVLGRVDVDGRSVDGRLFDSAAAEDPGRLLLSGRVDVDGRLLDGRSLEGLLGFGRLLLLLLFGLLLLLFGRLLGLWLLL